MSRSLPVVVLILMSFIVAPVCAETVDVTTNTYFFSSQTPLSLAAAGGEWGVSSGASLLPGKPEGYKSRSKAMLLSLLLPGLGDVYVGDSRMRAAGFLTAEIGIWSAVVFNRQLGKWKKNDYMEYAVVYAGVDPTGKDDTFWDMVGFHDSRDDYNKLSRVYTRTNPFYPETSEWDWQWQSDEERKAYRDLKNDSKTYYRAARFALAAAVLNRAVSAFFAWRVAGGHNRRLLDQFSNFNIEVRPDAIGDSPEIRLTFSRIF